MVSQMLWTCDAVCDDWGPKIAATPVFIRWQTRFDAWKLSCGIIRSISAWSLERGKILLSAFILSTAYRNAISCGSVVWWSLSLGNGENRPPKGDKTGESVWFMVFWKLPSFSFYRNEIERRETKRGSLYEHFVPSNLQLLVDVVSSALFLFNLIQQYTIWISIPAYGERRYAFWEKEKGGWCFYGLFMFRHFLTPGSIVDEYEIKLYASSECYMKRLMNMKLHVRRCWYKPSITKVLRLNVLM